MPVLPKTEQGILALVKRHAEPGAARGDYWDPVLKGLSLIAGARSAAWYALYVDATGKRRRVRIGAFMHPATGGARAPYMSIADARETFASLKGEARQSRDPFSRRDEIKSSITVAELCDEYMRKYASKKVSADQIGYIIKNDVLPAIGERRVLALTRRDVHAVMDRALGRDAPIMANRNLEVVRSMFGWAVERGIMQVNPALGISKPAEEKSRARVLNDAELKALWHQLDDWQSVKGLAESVADEFRLLMLLGTREREVGGARWDEIDFERRILTLPADIPGRSKGRDHPHVVPLSAPAVQILRRLKLKAGRSAYVFPSPLSSDTDRPATQSRMENAKQALEVKLSEQACIFGQDWRIHDLRRTVRTRLSELKVQPHVAELVIGHSLRGIIKVYDRFEYLEEKRDALDRWSIRLAEIVANPLSDVSTGQAAHAV